MIQIVSNCRSFLLTALALGCWLMTSPAAWAQKIPLKHEIYNDWQSFDDITVSPDGQWLHYQINPAKGDGTWFVVGSDNLSRDSFPRVKEAQYVEVAQAFALRLSPFYDSLRLAKLAKVKKEKLPQDSLVIWYPTSGEQLAYANLSAFSVPEAGNWLAFTTKMPKDTTKKKKGKKTKGAKDNKLLTLLNVSTKEEQQFENVRSFKLSPKGETALFVHQPVDTLDSLSVMVWRPSGSETVIGLPTAQVKRLASSDRGDQFAFLATTDTSEQPIFKAYLVHATSADYQEISADLSEDMVASPAYTPNFSKSGERLFFEAIDRPDPLPEDTLLKEEKMSVDVWTWHDRRLQPQQLVELNNDKERGVRMYWDGERERIVQIGQPSFARLSIELEGDAPFALAYDNTAYQMESSWNSPGRRDVYMIDMTSGENKLIISANAYGADLSPGGEYLVYYKTEDRNYWVYDVESQEHRNLTGSLSVNFYDEEFDEPMDPYPYRGLTYLSESEVVINDRYDLWKFDLAKAGKPENLTKGWGRAHEVRLRTIKVDQDSDYLGDSLLIQGASERTKAEVGFWYDRRKAFNPEKSEKLFEGPFRVSALSAHNQGKHLTYQKMTFRDQPTLFWSRDGGASTKAAVAIDQINPEALDTYRWGEVSLVEWDQAEDDHRQGLLYIPDGIAPGEKVPMLIYFYEVLSQRRYYNYPVSPSRSTINIPWYVSNGYAVFVPDIRYQTGQPGPDALATIMSGTDAVLSQFDMIDSTKMALQGQSWGGYQVAYMITQTNRFAAAMAGAPVSNMTSAYGGIRWGSGRSRMFQYERTQSRLGTTLWEDTERYMRNSPLFYLPQVETPVMMMHNDADGAVPWYQGIEMFVSLRRLRKPVWMVVYNDEAHNLRRWPNRVDLSIRMAQFFDYYLKGKPMPIWMKEGVPALVKGKETGYEMEMER